MKCSIDRDVGILTGPFTLDFLKHVIAKLAGKKKWTNSMEITFYANQYNLALITSCCEYVELDISNEPTEGELEEITPINYTPKLPLLAHQVECLERSWLEEAYAIFMECGLGKTCVEIANIGKLAAANKITGVLIVAPNGVYEQWIDEELPKHADPNMHFKTHVWNGKSDLQFNKTNAHCEMLAMNFEALRLKKERIVGTTRWRSVVSEGYEVAERFIDTHKGRVIIIVDESHSIKSYKSLCTKALWALGKKVDYRRILTGTPIAKNLLDLWSQFMFLNPNIIGYDNIVTYRAHFCILGGFDNKLIIGEQNVEELYSIIAPYTYRKTKKEATDLPDKIYVKRRYEMSAVTRRHYDSMKKMWLTRFDNGEIKDAPNGLTAMLRLQQIICGFLEREDGTLHELGSERLDAMMEIIEQVEGQVIIWARFTQDIINIANRLETSLPNAGLVTYYGEASSAERAASKRKFMEGQARFFVGNIGISAGLDGLQCARNMIYYSCDFNALHRWQSEDRAHRYGMGDGLTVFDLVAKGSIDNPILDNLATKKSLSDLTLDQIRMAISES